VVQIENTEQLPAEPGGKRRVRILKAGTPRSLLRVARTLEPLWIS